MAEVRSKETEAVTLFRFSNIYDPTTREPEPDDQVSTITNGNTAASDFLDAIEGAASIGERDEALQGVIDTFSPFATGKEVIAIDSDLYEFGSFIKLFNSKTTSETLVDRTTGLSELSQPNLDLIWDNLYFQAVTTRSAVVANALVRMLRANAFLLEYNAQVAAGIPSDKQKQRNFNRLYRLAGANVEIPGKLISREIPEPTLGKVGLSARTKDFLIRKNNSDRARFKISLIEKAISEVKCAEEAYSKAYRETAELLGSKGNGGKYVSTATPRTDSSQGKVNIDLSKLADKYIKDDSKQLIESLVCFDSLESFDQVLKALRAEKAKKFGVLSKNKRKLPRQVLFKGVVLTEPNTIQNNTFVMSSEKISGTDGKVRLILTQHFTNPEKALVSVSLNTSHPTLGDAEFSSNEPFYRSSDHVSFLLFKDGLQVNDEGFSLSFSFVLEEDPEPKSMDFLDYTPEKQLFERFSTDLEMVFLGDLVKLCEDKKLNGVKRLGVLEYKKVEQQTCCYVAGEVSHIENIMAREYREKVTRNLTRSEIVQEDTTEKEVENLTDTTTTDRYEMQTEISQMQQEEQSQETSISAGIETEFKPSDMFSLGVSFSTDSSWTSGSSSTNNFSQSETFAQEITQRALERIVTKTTSKRTSRMLREFEETNTHGFDNRAGEKHVTGIYRWVDKIYENKLYNYGKRLLYEFMVPEPSKNFKSWMTVKNPDPNTPEIRKPRDLSEFDFRIGDPDEDTPGNLTEFSWNQITEDNYADLAAEYGADVEPPLVSEIEVEGVFSGNPGSTGTTDPRTGADSFELTIPDGYACVAARYNYSHIYYGSSASGAWAYVTIANKDIWESGGLRGTNTLMNNYTNLNVAITGKLGVTVVNRDISSFSINVIGKCERIPELYEAWQRETYISILNAYYKKLDDYNNAVAAANVVPTDTEPTDFRYNPGIGRAIEQRELKRLCIEMMLEPFSDITQLDAMGLSHYDQEDCRWKLNTAKNCLNRHATYVKFMEDAFDWDIFSYKFLPYYWASVCEWESLIKQKSSSDPLFEAFLQSGMAKVTLPIKAGYEFQVLYFMESGLIWNVNTFEVLPEIEKAYESIKVDLEIGPYIVGTDQLCPESCWQSRVPTALTIIQTNSAPLNANGLPCHLCEDGTEVHCDGCDCSGCSSLEGTAIGTGNNVLAGLGESGSGGTSTSSSKSSFLFPKHGDLSSNDVGKLVMNDGDGLAKVSQLADPLPEQLGNYIIKLTDLADLIDDSAIDIETGGIQVYFNRIDWRGMVTPADPLAELNLIKDYIDADATLSANFTTSIVDDELVLEEIAMLSSEVKLSDWPDFSLEVVVTSQPASPAAPVGFPLGKLLGIDGDNAIISSELVETYTLESAFSVSHELFNSGYELDITSGADLTQLTNHVMIPAADGKVKPAELAYEDMIDSHFINTYRNQFVGVAINTSGMEVTVMRMSYLSFLTHGVRRMRKEGLLGND
ncbi:MAG: hypothetical protein K9J17_08500 [Flavobacteriales bacterium]|nr:hypothetical protein [Flavobacteriales bacterium]